MSHIAPRCPPREKPIVVGSERTSDVDEPCPEEAFEERSLVGPLSNGTCLALLGMHVHVRPSHVHVTREDELEPARVDIAHPRLHRFEKVELGRVVLAAVRNVDRREHHLAELRRDNPCLEVEVRMCQVGDIGESVAPHVQSDSRVRPRAMPIAGISLEIAESRGDLRLGRLQLLQTDDIGLVLVDPRFYLLLPSPDPVHVPSANFHVAHLTHRRPAIDYTCAPMRPLTLEPIGVVRSPFRDRVSAPRQPAAAEGIAGTIELLPGRNYEHALEDLEGWEYLFVVFWFHLNEGWRPKVLPPRSERRRGVFSTRSPHRPNPIGLSVVKLESVEGLVLHIRNVDMLDGTPVLDIKPYVPYTDAIPAARTGWLTPLVDDLSSDTLPKDPEPGFHVTWSELAAEQARWLASEHDVNLAEPVTRSLELGPQPHPYRRIKREGDSLRLAVKDWRIRFRVEGRLVTVFAITTGYRPSQLALPSVDPAILVHQAFVARYESALDGVANTRPQSRTRSHP